MNFKEGKCPKCQGILHVPEGLDKVICMYCGEEAGISEILEETVEAMSEQGDIPADYESYVQVGMLELPKLLLDIENPLANFKKDKYEAAFDNLYHIYEDTLKAVDNAYLYSESKEELLTEFAANFVKEADKEIELLPKKGAKDQKLMDYNLSLAVYVIPIILQYKGKSSEPLADKILEEWKKAYPKTNVGKSDFENINNGFRKKLCYITTAVCETLGKGDDCYELTLLRNYRDEYLLSQEDGEEIVSEYYNIAPTIVNRINKMPDAKKIYKNVWEKYLKPCIRLIEEDNNFECKKIYTSMVRELQNEYRH